MTEEYMDASNIKEQKKEFERLLESPAWGMIVAAVQAQANSLQQRILFDEVTCEADLYRMERLKGQLEGRLSLSSTVTGMIASLEMDLDLAQNRRHDGLPLDEVLHAEDELDHWRRR